MRVELIAETAERAAVFPFLWMRVRLWQSLRVVDASQEAIRALAYTIAGLHVISEIALSGVSPCRDDRDRFDVVTIRQTRVPHSLRDPIATYPDGQWNGEELIIAIPEVARYLVSANRIDVEPAEGAGMNDVCAFLLGTVFGALCHLRGIFPLHASAIGVGNQCIAFAGDSRAGKSTTAASLIGRGHRLISDDVTYICQNDAGQIQIWPGTNRLRLWESAMEGLRYAKEGAERERRGFDKFLVPANPPADADRPLELNAIYQLEAAAQDAPIVIERLRGTAAVDVLLRNTFRLYIAEDVGRKRQVFAACTHVARKVPVFRLSRPMSFALLDLVSKKLEEHLAREVAVP